LLASLVLAAILYVEFDATHNRGYEYDDKSFGRQASATARWVREHKKGVEA